MATPVEPDKQDGPALGPTPKRVRKTWGIRFFLVEAALFAVFALAAAPHILQRQYTGEAIFELRLDPASEQLEGSRVTSLRTTQSTLEGDLCGREAMKQAAEELGLTKGLDHASDGTLTVEGETAARALVDRLRESVDVGFPTREEDILYRVALRFTHEDPDLAADVPNMLVRNYFARVCSRIVETLSVSREFLEMRAASAEARLQEAMRQRIEFEAKYGGMLPDSPGALQERMQQISTDMDTVRRQGAVARQTFERLKALAEKAAAAPGEPIQVVKGPNPEVARLHMELRRWEDLLERKIVLNGMTDDDAVVQRLHKKIEEIEKEIEETPEKIVLQEYYGSEGPNDNIKTALAAAQSEVEMADKELDRLQERLNAVQLLVANYAPLRQQYLELCKNVEELDAKKKSWQERLTGVQMALEAEVAKRRTHLEAVQVAEKPFLPESPKLSDVLGFALIGGLVYGGLLVFVHNIVNRSIARTFVWLAGILDPSALPAPALAAAHSEAPVDDAAAEAETRSSRTWQTVRRFVLQPVIALILVVFLGAAILNITLCLHYPDQYEQWKTDPTAYVFDSVRATIVEPVRELWQPL